MLRISVWFITIFIKFEFTEARFEARIALHALVAGRHGRWLGSLVRYVGLAR